MSFLHRWVFAEGGATFRIAELGERSVQELFHHVNGRATGLIKGRADVRHDEGLVPGGPGFEKAALVVAVRFAAVVVDRLVSDVK